MSRGGPADCSSVSGRHCEGSEGPHVRVGRWPDAFDAPPQPCHSPHLRLVPLPHGGLELVTLLLPPRYGDGFDRGVLTSTHKGQRAPMSDRPLTSIAAGSMTERAKSAPSL